MSEYTIIEANTFSKADSEFLYAAAAGDSFRSDRTENLGLYKKDGGYYTKGYTGVMRLTDRDGRVIKDGGKECVLTVNPRSDMDIWYMLDTVMSDKEYEEYIKDRNGTEAEEKFYKIFTDQPPLYMETSEEQDSDLLAAITFIRLCKSICMRRLKPVMEKTEKNFTGKVKGKIVFEKNIKFNESRGRKDRIYCRYARSTVDSAENRILKAALIKAKKILARHADKMRNIHSMARFCMTALDDVQTVTVTSGDFSKIKLTGFYAYYKPAIAYAKMLINNISAAVAIDGNKEKKKRYILPYMIKTEALFEFFARSVIKKQLENKPRFKLIEYSSKLKLLSGGGKGTHLQENCIPDIIIADKDSGYIYVYDVKCKYKGSFLSEREDSFQLLSYAYLLNAVKCGFIMPFDENNCICSDDNNACTADDLTVCTGGQSISSYKYSSSGLEQNANNDHALFSVYFLKTKKENG